VDTRGCFKIITNNTSATKRIRLPIIDTANTNDHYIKLTKDRYLVSNHNSNEGVVNSPITPHEKDDVNDDDDDELNDSDDESYSSSNSSTTASSSSVEGIITRRRNDIIARTEAISKSINAKDFDELLRSNSSGRRLVNGNNNTTANSNTNNICSSSNSNTSSSSSNEQFSVLIVEDTDICAKFLTMQLTRMDCKTYRAENGRIAVDILQHYIISSSSSSTSTLQDENNNIVVPAVVPYDMILMDLRMPIMSGLEATKLIRSELKLYDLPIIALTGEMIDGCKEECKGVGFNDYFQKPIKKDKLEMLINKYKNMNDERRRRRRMMEEEEEDEEDCFVQGERGDATTTVNQGGMGNPNINSSNIPTLRRTSSSTSGIVRTTSGTSVRELIRRHKSKQSMENMTNNLLAQGDSEVANMILSRTNSTSIVTNFNLVRPPPRRSTIDNNNINNNDYHNSSSSKVQQQVLTLDTTMPLSILIVEDTDVCAKFLTMQLERMNCSTQRAENGQVAVDILRKALPGTFDLVLMDLRMPVLDGLDATRIIKSKLQLKELPVVALTGEMIEGCRVECAGIGFDDFFQKPMKKDKLEALINKYKSIRDGRSGGGGHHIEVTTTGNAQSVSGIMPSTSVGGTTRTGVLRSSRRSLNALNSSLFVPDSHKQNANFDDFLQMTTMRRSTTMAGKSDGGGQLHIKGGHLGPRQLSIDQQLQDPNLKMFTKTIHSIGRSTSRESFQASLSSQQLGSTNSFVNQNVANATWESSQPSREASVVSSSTQGSAMTIMPRNSTLQRIKENDNNNLTQQTNGSNNAAWGGEEVPCSTRPVKPQPDLTSIMSKMVTSTGVGGNNIRVASMQDFRGTGYSSNKMERNISSLQRIKEANVSTFDGTSKNASWDNNNNATTPLNESSLLKIMSSNGGIMSSSSSNPLLQMMAAREQQQSQGNDASSNSSGNSLLQMMAARKSQQ
jgi:CheY-like chemotaxis protein